MDERGARLQDRARPWLGAVGVVVLVTACGGGGDGGTRLTPSVPIALPATPPEVLEALLTPEDLGDGWIDLGAVPQSDRGFSGCPQTQVITGGDDPARLGEAQRLLADGQPPGPILGESISLWESPEVAGDRLATIASTVTECPTFQHELLDGRSSTVAVVQRDAPPLGDEAVALEHQVAPDEGPSLVLDVIVVRVGSALVLTDGERVDGDPVRSLDQRRFDELTGLAVEKARSTLPAP